MISRQQIVTLTKKYKKESVHIGVLGGHSALDVAHGAKAYGFNTVVVCQKGREKTYSKYYRNLFDEIIVVDKFEQVTSAPIVKKLQKLNTIFVHNRYFWVYCKYKDVETKFHVPIFGTRNMVKLEERDVPKNQYYLLKKAGIRIPKLFKSPKDIDRLVIVKVAEAARGYERAFFFAASHEQYDKKSSELIRSKAITKADLKKAVIEEYIIGAHVNFNFFYSPVKNELELLGTDTRRQTNLDGLLRLPAPEQFEVLKHVKPKLIETGHVAVTVKESLLEKAFALGEKFIAVAKKENPPGIIGGFALQGAVSAEEGKEEIVVFDVSMRIPGSPGTSFTPYSAYKHGESKSYGQRTAMEIDEALHHSKLDKILT